MSTFRVVVRAVSLASILFPTLLFANEPDFKREYTLSWTAGLAASTKSQGELTALGGNEYLFLEARVVPGLSLGIGAGIFGMTSGPDADHKTVSFDVGGRLFPLRMKWGEAYLMGGMGYNAFHKVTKNPMTGRFHASAGAGLRRFLGQGWALDMGADYHFFTPIAKPLQSYGVKAGLTIFLGGNRTHKNEMARKAMEERNRLAAAEQIKQEQLWRNWYKEYQMRVVSLRAKAKVE